ncbi:hypothetical protein ACLOJK_014797, partial [Asimina triloba]
NTSNDDGGPPDQPHHQQAAVSSLHLDNSESRSTVQVTMEPTDPRSSVQQSTFGQKSKSQQPSISRPVHQHQVDRRSTSHLVPIPAGSSASNIGQRPIHGDLQMHRSVSKQQQWVNLVTSSNARTCRSASIRPSAALNRRHPGQDQAPVQQRAKKQIQAAHPIHVPNPITPQQGGAKPRLQNRQHGNWAASTKYVINVDCGFANHSMYCGFGNRSSRNHIK